jgi:hypothetical protein
MTRSIRLNTRTRDSNGNFVSLEDPSTPAEQSGPWLLAEWLCASFQFLNITDLARERIKLCSTVRTKASLEKHLARLEKWVFWMTENRQLPSGRATAGFYESIEAAFFIGLLVPEAEYEQIKRGFASKGGRASGATRAVRPWHAHARELAKSINSREPSFSRDKLATEIITCWKNDESCPVGHRQMTKFLTKEEGKCSTTGTGSGFG